MLSAEQSLHRRVAAVPLPLQGRQIGYNILGSLVKGDSPQCGEMSRSDRGDGHRFGGGNAVGVD